MKHETCAGLTLSLHVNDKIICLSKISFLDYFSRIFQKFDNYRPRFPYSIYHTSPKVYRCYIQVQQVIRNLELILKEK